MRSSHLRGNPDKYYRTIAATILAAVGFAVSAPSAYADCGDDIDGERVACHCGDRVVTDTRLLPGDPVVARACVGNGLLVRVGPKADGITLNLGGLTIRGSGYGVGIRVLSGGADGVVVLGGDEGQKAEIVGFGTGLQARDPMTVKRVGRIEFRGNSMLGAWLRSMDAELFDLSASHNLGGGLRLRGRNVTLTGLDSHDNGGNGLTLHGVNTTVSGSVTNNTGAGVVSMGRGLDLAGLESAGNGKPDSRGGLSP